MKTSSVLASVLFGAIAAAAPLDKRALVTKTNVVVETVVIYTTVWDGETATAAATTTPAPAAFYEVSSSRARRSRSRGPKSSSAVAAPTSVYVPPQVTSIAEPSSKAPVSSSVYVAPPVPSTTEEVAPPTPEAPAPSSEAPSSTYVAPPVASSTTPEQPTSTGGSGEVHSGGSMTIHPFGGALGACGDPISDDSMSVALAGDLFGYASVDFMTGKTTNKWCNAKVAITYNGKTTNAVIKDKCDGCTNGGFDMSIALWNSVTNNHSPDRITGMTWTLVD